MSKFKSIKYYVLVCLLCQGLLNGCATLTNDPMTPIAISFSDGSAGTCELTNKRGAWSTEIPTTVSVRRSDDALKFQCETKDGRRVVGSIESRMGAKIVASAVFLDLGITDAITDMHREYDGSFVIPVPPREGIESTAENTSKDTGAMGDNIKRNEIYNELEKLDDLRSRGIITDEEFESEKRKLLENN